jgi:sugar phosphate isomerase/epimerase
MLIGTMNHPGNDVISEIRWMAEMGFEFLDLTIEPPKADVRRLDLRTIKEVLGQTHFEIVGHTAYYLPISSPFESLRCAAVGELKICMQAFAELGACWMNLHPDSIAPMHDRKYLVQQNLKSLRDLMPLSRQTGVGLMIENLPGNFNTVAQLAEILDAMPEVGLHLDIGHANLMVQANTTDQLLAAYGNRLRHVHFHDNKGGHADLHLPLGAGTIDTAHCVRLLQAAGYDGTITLEVFTPDRHHLSYSREVLRRVWDECAEERAAARTNPAVVLR